MRISICTYGLPAAELVDLVRFADEAGFTSVWVGEHMVVPVHQRSEHPTQPGGGMALHNGKPIVELSTELADPLVALGAGAAATTRVQLATGIYILPLRHPLVTARAAATVHELSGGRLILGVGSGWLEEEFDALQVPFANRRGRYEESIEILRAAWEGGPFSFHGRHFSFADVQVSPRPVPVPLVVGGNTDPALRRAARIGDGWLTSGTPTFDEAVRLHDRARDLADTAGRGGSFRAFVRMAGVDPGDAAKYREAGVDDLVVWAHAIFAGVAPDQRQNAVVEAGRLLDPATV